MSGMAGKSRFLHPGTAALSGADMDEPLIIARNPLGGMDSTAR